MPPPRYATVLEDKNDLFILIASSMTKTAPILYEHLLEHCRMGNTEYYDGVLAEQYIANYLGAPKQRPQLRGPHASTLLLLELHEPLRTALLVRAQRAYVLYVGTTQRCTDRGF